MAAALPSGEVVDLFGGVEDLRAGVLRTPRSPEESFSEDPLRMMRAARFAARFNLEVAPEVFEAMREMAGRIEIISAERVRDELVKLIEADYPRGWFEPAGGYGSGGLCVAGASCVAYGDGSCASP